MSNKIFLTVIMFSILTITGCGVRATQDNVVATNSNVVNASGLKLIDSAQDAVFYIATGWDGGMGTMPVLNDLGNSTLSYNDLPVFFSESYQNIIREKLPSCYSGKPEIKISANVILEKQSGINHSIPTDENGDEASESYYTVKVNKLNDIEVKAEGCKD